MQAPTIAAPIETLSRRSAAKAVTATSANVSRKKTLSTQAGFCENQPSARTISRLRLSPPWGKS